MPNNLSLSAEHKDYLQRNFFGMHSVQQTSGAIDVMFFDFLASETADDNDQRNEMIVSYRCMKRLLHVIMVNENDVPSPTEIVTLQL